MLSRPDPGDDESYGGQLSEPRVSVEGARFDGASTDWTAFGVAGGNLRALRQGGGGYHR